LLPPEHDRVVLYVLTEIRFPPHTRIERYSVRHAPCILHIRAQVPVVDIQDARAADLEPRDASTQEIRKGVPGQATVNGPGAAGAGRGPCVELPVAGVRAEAELMAPPHEGDVVGDPVKVMLRPPLPAPNQ